MNNTEKTVIIATVLVIFIVTMIELFIPIHHSDITNYDCINANAYTMNTTLYHEVCN